MDRVGVKMNTEKFVKLVFWEDDDNEEDFAEIYIKAADVVKMLNLFAQGETGKTQLRATELAENVRQAAIAFGNKEDGPIYDESMRAEGSGGPVNPV